MRKMIDSEQRKTDMQNKILQLERECTELAKTVEDLESKIGNTKKIETEKQ